MSGHVAAAESTIKIGEHVTVEFLGMTVNMDTVWTTVIAGGIVVGLGFWMRSKVSSGVPSKVQMIWEAVVKEVTTQVEANLGRVHPFVVPLAVALFLFILIANWIEVIPSGEHPKVLPSPTADINLTMSMALLVIVGVWTFGIREKGAKNYFKHFIEPYPVLLPLNILEEITKPFTLALRLFGNIFASGIMIALIGLMPLYTLWGANIVWKLFAMFIGAIQAFIFALLTVLYFGAAGAHDEAGHEDRATESETPESETPESETPELDTSEPEPVGAR